MRHAPLSVSTFGAVRAATFAACIAVGLTVGSASPAAAGDAVALTDAPQILVIFSADPSQSWIRNLTDGFIATEYGPERVAPAWFFEHLDALRFQEPDRDEQFRDALRAKYWNRRLDLIVPVSSNAIAFVRDVHDQLWPGVRVLSANYADRALAQDAEAPSESVLTFEGGVDLALGVLKTVFPDTTAVAMTAGISEAERRNESEIGGIVRSEGLEFVDLRSESLDGLVSQVERLPAHALLFLAGGQVDANGAAVPTWRMCESLSRAANRPAFMLGSQFLGCGIVGGLMRDYTKIGTIIGERAAAMVAGGPRPTDRVPFSTIATLTFDERMLDRWGVDQARLPAGSVIAFRRASLWRDYRNEVTIVGVGLLVQSGLILRLLFERRKRRKAELDSRRSLAVAAHADRRAAVAALTGSIAHELNQPLGSILHNAYAAELLVASNQATPEALQAILRDIRNDDTRAAQIVQRHRTLLKKREMDQRPVDIHTIVRESLALLANDAEERQVLIHTTLTTPGMMVFGDPVLLQQVIVNLVVNAMDAVSTLPPGRRHVDVRTATAGSGVEVAVRDSGPGLPPELQRVLFEPFVTTKPDGIGIGLTIVRGIVEVHGGTINAKNNPEGGVTFRFTLPAGAAA